MDKATLNGLQNQIKQVQDKMRSLSDSAKQTLESLQSELASLQGNDDEVRRIRHAQKLADLHAKIAEATKQQNQEALAQYQRALSLQEQINAEENRQAEVKNSTSATNLPESSPSSGNQNDLSAKDIGDMWQKHMEAMKQEVKTQAKAEFIKEMRDDIKRRAR